MNINLTHMPDDFDYEQYKNLKVGDKFTFEYEEINQSLDFEVEHCETNHVSDTGLVLKVKANDMFDLVINTFIVLAPDHIFYCLHPEINEDINKYRVVLCKCPDEYRKDEFEGTVGIHVTDAAPPPTAEMNALCELEKKMINNAYEHIKSILGDMETQNEQYST